METRAFVRKINEIEMPEEMRKRIMKGCNKEKEKMEMEDMAMSKNISGKKFGKRMVAASLALCLCLTGVTVIAAGEKLQGFFKDITRWDGAVIATSYEQAGDEIRMSAEAGSEELSLTVTMIYPEQAPYSSLENIGIADYEIMDMDGNLVLEGKATETGKIVDAKAKVQIPLEGVPVGEYKLVIQELTGEAKAEQPLAISGIWECEFEK